MKNSIYSYIRSLNFIFLCFLLILSAYFTSCASSPEFIDKPVGNKIDLIQLSDTTFTELELLFVNEDSIYTLTPDSKVMPIPVKDVNKIIVNGYSDRNWLIGVIGLQVVPSIMMGLTYSSVNKNGNGLALTGIMLIPAVLEFTLFELSTPENPEFNILSGDKITKLRKYCRYPIEMKREQINALEKFYGINCKKINTDGKK